MTIFRLLPVLAMSTFITAACDGADSLDDGQPGSDGKSDDPDARSWRQIGDVFGVPNLDDDDDNGVDWEQLPFTADNDLQPLTFSAAVFDDMPAGHRLRLSLSGATGSVRIWRGSQVALGSGAQATSTVLDGPAALAVEFGDYNARATLAISELDSDGDVVDSGQLALHSSPLILNHHLQPAEHLWAVSVSSPGFNNQAFVNAYASALGSRFTKVAGFNYDFDIWLQDEIEFATATRPGGRLDVVIDSIRDRGLDDFPEDQLVAPGVIAETWGRSFDATTFDSFGNLEASPPVTVGGTEFPFGRIYYGRKGGIGLDDELATFLAGQQIQAPIQIDTTWLCVGHVDEIISFVPDQSSPKGFKLLLADVPSALAILGTLPTSRTLPKYQFDHGYSTVGELRSDANLIATNQDVQADFLSPIKQQLKAALGLTDADIILVPSLFEHVPGCGAGDLVALIPGMVNLIVANPTGEATKLFIPDPFFRSNLADQSSDPFIAAFAADLPDGLELHFVDNWDVYHLNRGEVHCGTNVRRTPTAAWWNGGN